MQKARRHLITQAPTACRHTVSGTISLPCLGCFSPFPYGTGSLSVSEEYLALPDGAGRFKQDFSGPALLRILLVRVFVRLRGCHALWLCFPTNSASKPFLNAVLQPPGSTLHGFRLFPFRSPLLRESFVIFFSSRYLDVSVLGVGFSFQRYYTFSIVGCPIRKSTDLILVCSSP
jgi:hypothetical protein